jgi:hypothetical protein
VQDTAEPDGTKKRTAEEPRPHRDAPGLRAAVASGRGDGLGCKKRPNANRRKTMANCEDFTITLRNSTHGEIKATKFEYKDGSNWKIERMFGLDGIQKIEKDHSISFKRDLEGIGGESTQFRVTYQHHLGGTKWSADKSELSDTFTALDNGAKMVTLTA